MTQSPFRRMAFEKPLSDVYYAQVLREKFFPIFFVNLFAGCFNMELV